MKILFDSRGSGAGSKRKTPINSPFSETCRYFLLLEKAGIPFVLNEIPADPG
jgi:hypothetical protein